MLRHFGRRVNDLSESWEVFRATEGRGCSGDGMYLTALGRTPFRGVAWARRGSRERLRRSSPLQFEVDRDRSNYVDRLPIYRRRRIAPLLDRAGSRHDEVS